MGGRAARKLREPSSNATTETVLTAGCDTGEVFVSGRGWRWRVTNEGKQLMYGFPVGVESPSGTNFANPFGKAFKRVDEGTAGHSGTSSPSC